jgi:hypothetical protein
LAGGLVPGRIDNGLLHGCRVLVAESGDLIGDHHGAGQVDVPGSERSAGEGQAAQRDSQAEHLIRGAPG